MGYQNLVFDKESVFLVTGGAGFIGSNLCEAILNLGYTVRCLDNLSTGKYENLLQQIRSLPLSKGIFVSWIPVWRPQRMSIMC